MLRHIRHAGLVALFLFSCGTAFLIGRAAQAPAPGPQLVRLRRAAGCACLLLDAPQLGGPEVAAGERCVVRPTTESARARAVESIEIIYVLSGRVSARDRRQERAS